MGYRWPMWGGIREGLGLGYSKGSLSLPKSRAWWRPPVHSSSSTPEEPPSIYPTKLAKHITHDSLAVLFRHPAEGCLRVHLSRGYLGEDLATVRILWRGPVMRHLVAHPVQVDVSSLTRLPWFRWAPRGDRDALHRFWGSRVVPLRDGGSLVGLLLIPVERTRLRRNSRAPSSDEIEELVALVQELQSDLAAEQTANAVPGADTDKPGPTLPPEVREVAHDLNNNFASILAHAQALTVGQDTMVREAAESNHADGVGRRRLAEGASPAPGSTRRWVQTPRGCESDRQDHPADDGTRLAPGTYSSSTFFRTTGTRRHGSPAGGPPVGDPRPGGPRPRNPV